MPINPPLPTAPAKNLTCYETRNASGVAFHEQGKKNIRKNICTGCKSRARLLGHGL